MSKIKNKKSQLLVKEGMTLVEVMAVIAIIGIMSAVSIVSFISSKRSAELETAAEEIVAVLREAQNYSLTGKGISANCNNYRVTFLASSDYSLMTYDANGGSSCAGVSSAYSLKNGVVSSAVRYVNFAAPHGEITSNAPLSGDYNVITISKGGISYYICINSVGLIKKTLDPNCN